MTELAKTRALPAEGPQGLADVKQLLATVSRGWRLILATVLVCMTCMTLYVLTARRVYQATTRLLILQSDSSPIRVSKDNSGDSGDSREDYIPTHSLLITSPLVVERAIKEIGLENLPSLQVAIKKDIRPVDQAIDMLKVTRPDRLAKIIKVDYWAYSPKEAARLLDAVTRSYETTLKETYTEKSNKTIELIQTAQKELAKELEVLGKKQLSHRNEASYVLGSESGRSLMAQRLERSGLALKETEENERRLRFQYDLGQKLATEGMEMWAVAHAINQLGGDSTSLNAAIGGGTVMTGGNTAYIQQLTALQQELAEKHGPDNSKVQEIEEQIVRIQERAQRSRGRLDGAEIKSLLGSIRESLAAVQAMRKEAEKQFEVETDKAKGVEIEMLKGAQIQAEIERTQRLFDTVLEQLKQAEYAKDASSITSQVIDRPRALQVPTWPKTNILLAASLVLGLGLGVTAVLVVDRMDQRFRSVKQLRATLGLPVLGQITQIADKHVMEGKEIGLISATMPRSVWAEGYRSLRTNLDFLGRTRKTKTLLLTSPYSGDGKSTSASNLAVSTAQAGRKVVLVDCDLRRASQHKIFGLSNSVGLTDVLTGRLRTADVIKPTSVENLHLVCTGASVPNPAELLTSPRLSEFVKELEGLYDLVIFDSSPMLAVTDPAIVSSCTDGVVLVVRMTQFRHHDAEVITEWANSLTVPILGVVVNAVEVQAQGYGYGYGGYGYGYGYGYGSYGYGTYDQDGNPHGETGGDLGKSAGHENHPDPLGNGYPYKNETLSR